MMRPIRFVTRMFAGGFDDVTTESDRERSRNALLLLLHSLTGINKLWLKQYPDTPSVYRGGVSYAMEHGTEDWLDIPTILHNREADCEDLASARCAELQILGVRAKPFIRWAQNPQTGRWTYHCLVWRPKDSLKFSPPPVIKTPAGLVLYPSPVRGDTGLIEDPSRLLGMGWEEAFAETNREPTSAGFLQDCLKLSRRS